MEEKLWFYMVDAGFGVCIGFHCFKNSTPPLIAVISYAWICIGFYTVKSGVLAPVVLLQQRAFICCNRAIWDLQEVAASKRDLGLIIVSSNLTMPILGMAWEKDHSTVIVQRLNDISIWIWGYVTINSTIRLPFHQNKGDAGLGETYFKITRKFIRGSSLSYKKPISVRVIVARTENNMLPLEFVASMATIAMTMSDLEMQWTPLLSIAVFRVSCR